MMQLKDLSNSVKSPVRTEYTILEVEILVLFEAL